ncbi:unnamed protein product [Rhizoctonia solani]|uniref:Uncharacterized protein n=1 Tax=Rhizoctonia solani TaxID=456999 RepID=A0A8H3CMA3_9AGAM|nr:unnamed protein product [Rhizoctonia solani]CAE6487987.1 unnamed protein product [Rhizoctonia solani]
MLTRRPMFFRFDGNYPPLLSDTFRTDDGAGLRWLYGVLDWLTAILARMNTLLEDCGSGLDPAVTTGREEDIRSKRTTVAAGVARGLRKSRIVVQDSWWLVALTYVLMAPCGADSKDAPVTKVRAKFKKRYAGVEARRIPDSFLVLLILILGLPGPVKGRKLIRGMMVDLMERFQPYMF